MNLCSHQHDEICFDGGECPLCKMAEELQRRDSQIDEDSKTICCLEEELNAAEKLIAELQKDPLVKAIEQANQKGAA